MISSNKIKILILSHSSELGGAEKSMIDLFDYWAGKGLIEPHFIIRSPLRGMVKELKKREWEYYPLYYTNWSQRNPSSRAEDIFRNARENSKAVFEIEKLIDQIEPDLVMTNTIVSPWAAIAAYFKQIPHVWFVREYGDIDHRHVFELGREKMLQDIDSLSELIVTNSQTLANHVTKYVEEDHVTTLYTPFDLDLLERKARQKTKNPFKEKDSLKLVITGRIAPSKGQAEAAQAVGELNKRGLKTELCVIGTPAEEEDASELHEVIKKYGIEKLVHLVGHKGNPLSVVAHADVGIMASKQEAFGRVTFEYMATGLPVVGANSGATPELIENKVNGLLFNHETQGDLQEKLSVYAKDRSLIEKNGAAAKKKAQNMMKGTFSADDVFEKLKSVKQIKKMPPINFAHRWVEYPLIAQQYIDDTRVISMKRLLYSRVRGKVKGLYLRTLGIIERIKKHV